MRKTIIFALAALMLLTAQCKKNEPKLESQEDMVMVPITGTITFGGDSKTDITTGGYITPVSDDKIYIYSGGSYVGDMTCTPTTGQQFTCSGEIDQNCVGKECVFMYLGTGSKEADGSTAISNTSSTISFADQSSVSVADGKITNMNKFHVGSCTATVSVGGDVTLPMRTKMAIAYFKLIEDNNPTKPIRNAVVTISGHYNTAKIKTSDGTISGATLGNITVKTDNNGCFYMALIPHSSAVTFKFSVFGYENATNTFPYSINANSYYCAQGSLSPLVVNMGVPVETDEWIDFNDPDVDVKNLPIWAKYNLGANVDRIINNFNSAVATDWYGDYYAWGATTTLYTGSGQNPSWKPGISGGYCANNCPYYNGGVYSKYTPYDSRLSLEPSDDVAHVVKGGDWRINTMNEWSQLTSNAFWVWTNSYRGKNNLKGYVVYKVKNVNEKGQRRTSSGNGTITVNGRTYAVDGENYQPHLFLPAAGGYRETSLNGVGDGGAYWSSAVIPDGNYVSAFFQYFDQANVMVAGSDRFQGLVIRPVR